MSGIEFIVGTVLASVPIALEIYDRSGRVFEVFSVFKQYPKEVRILEAKISAQRSIFRNNAINLLTAITKDRVKVQEVVNHPSLEAARLGLVMASVYENRVDALDESLMACHKTAEQIHNTLQPICLQFESFRAELGDKRDKMNASDWLKQIKTRFKLGMNKPEIAQAIQELRDFNRDFGSITEQIARALQEILNEHKDHVVFTRKSVRTLNMLQRYHRIRYASKALYSTLQVQWMCSSHRYHSFDVRILDYDPGKGSAKASVTQYVTCELAITHDGSFPTSKEPLRLEIEQACESDNEDTGPPQTIKDNANVQHLTTVLETNADRFKLATPAPKITNARRFLSIFRKDRQQQQKPRASTSQPPKLSESLAKFHIDRSKSMTATASSMSDLSLVDDFCKNFHEAMTDCMSRCLLGSWKGPDAQWFYVPPAPQTTLGTSKSLSDIIRWIADEPILRSLPRLLLVELAGNVAEGIMQFYSTPWLAPTDLGQNLRFFNPAELSASVVQLKGPYFTARLDSTRAKGKMSQTSTGPLPVDETAPRHRKARIADFMEARNKLLFNFGILLLEIGYGRPWHELKNSVVKMTTLIEGEMTNYRAAEKLAQLLVNQMGLTYPKIIKKCLGCDFGLGETDLDNEDLQRRFLEDVVSGLKQLEKQMRENSVWIG